MFDQETPSIHPPTTHPPANLPCDYGAITALFAMYGGLEEGGEVYMVFIIHDTTYSGA